MRVVDQIWLSSGDWWFCRCGANGSFSANGATVNYEAQTTTDSVRGWGNGCYTTNFLSSFSATPTVVATINKLDGGDGGWARRCSLSSSAVGLTIDEDQYKDTERNHTTEAVGMAAFSQSFDAMFTDGVSTWGMEAESVNLPAITGGSNWVSVSFRQAYTTTPVVVVLATNETTDPAAIRVRNVTTTGFEAAQVEPANNDGVQGAMTMHYVAAEVGTHELPDGTRILVDTVSIGNQQHGSGVTGSESWTTEAFAIWPGASSSPLPGSQVMTYDANGNRASLNEDSTLYAYSNLTNSNRILSAAGPTVKTYTYDLSGNVTGDGVHTYGYDDRGRLVDVDSGAATYVHNGQGQRVKKDNGSVTLFAYDEVGGLSGEYDSVGFAVHETVWFNGAPVAILDGVNQYFVHTDQLGSPRVITDGNTVIWRWQSDPFGVAGPDENPDGDANSFTYNLRFPGQYYDMESGLHYNYFRTLDPSTGRYLESDPIGLLGGLNTYGYVGGNPLRFVDPLGLAIQRICKHFFLRRDDKDYFKVEEDPAWTSFAIPGMDWTLGPDIDFGSGGRRTPRPSIGITPERFYTYRIDAIDVKKYFVSESARIMEKRCQLIETDDCTGETVSTINSGSTYRVVDDMVRKLISTIRDYRVRF